MSEHWTIREGAIHIGEVDDDGVPVPHRAYELWFGEECVCLGLDSQLSRIGFLAAAANNEMVKPGYFSADGRPTPCS